MTKKDVDGKEEANCIFNAKFLNGTQVTAESEVESKLYRRIVSCSNRAAWIGQAGYFKKKSRVIEVAGRLECIDKNSRSLIGWLWRMIGLLPGSPV